MKGKYSELTISLSESPTFTFPIRTIYGLDDFHN